VPRPCFDEQAGQVRANESGSSRDENTFHEDVWKVLEILICAEE
jgi:hypothetical protein